MPPQTRVLHIDITGHDPPGVTHALTSILARSEVRVLDIGQAVIHDGLAFGILIELPEELRSSALLTDLLLEAHRLGVQIQFTAISGDEYDAWVPRRARALHHHAARPGADRGAHGGGERRDRRRRAEHRSHRSPVRRTPLDGRRAGRGFASSSRRPARSRSEDEMRTALSR